MRFPVAVIRDHNCLTLDHALAPQGMSITSAVLLVSLVHESTVTIIVFGLLEALVGELSDLWHLSMRVLREPFARLASLFGLMGAPSDAPSTCSERSRAGLDRGEGA